MDLTNIRKVIMKRFLKRCVSVFIALTASVGIINTKNIYAEGTGVYYENKTVREVTNGVTYEKSRRLYSAGWMDVYVLTVDANTPGIEFDVLENTSGPGLKTTVPQLAQQNNAIAAVNGDFFASGNPRSSMGQVIKNGKVESEQNYYNGSEYRYAGFFVDNEGIPFIDYIKDSMGFYGSEKGAVVLGGKNKVTDFSMPVYFNRDVITNTSYLDNNFSSLTKIVVQDGTITKISSPGESVDIPENGYVIVMNNATRQEKIGYYSVGMKVSFDEKETFLFRPSKTISSLSFGISGGGELLRNGEIVSNGLIIGEAGRNPRTMLGINKEKTKVYIVCIDGRLNGIGATHAEAAQIMKEYGAYDAIHFDGGGSTTMVVRNNGKNELVNTPSEGQLRAVANGIGIKGTGENDVPTEIQAYVQGNDDNYILEGLSNTINVRLYDGKFNEMSIDTSKLEFSSNIPGSWNGNVFTPSQKGSGTITVKYGSLSDTINVKVLNGISAIRASAPSYCVEEGESIELSAKLISADGYTVNSDEDINWSVDDTEIGKTENGMFTGLSRGEAVVTAEYKGLKSEIGISVGKTYCAVDGLESGRKMNIYTSPEGSAVSGNARIISGGAHTGLGSLAISYGFEAEKTTTQAVYAGFAKAIELPSGSSDILMNYKGDGSSNSLKATLLDSNGKRAEITVASNLSDNEWKQSKNAIPTDMAQPVSLEKLYVVSYQTDSQAPSGTIYIDNITVAGSKSGSGTLSSDINDYMKADLDTVEGSNYEEISVYGGASGNNLSGVLTKMAQGARAVAFAGNASVTNNTGVPAVLWKNEYATDNTDNFSFVCLGVQNGSIAKKNPAQYRYLKDYVNNLSKKNIIILTDRYIPSNASLSDSREADAITDILSEAVRQSEKNIIVVSSTGESVYSEINKGVRYINIPKNSKQYLRLKGNSEGMYYQFTDAY